MEFNGNSSFFLVEDSTREAGILANAEAAMEFVLESLRWPQAPKSSKDFDLSSHHTHLYTVFIYIYIDYIIMIMMPNILSNIHNVT